VSTSSATGLMEAGVLNGARSRVLSLVNGAFSGRFAEIAEACGRGVDRYEVPWGEVHEPSEVARRLDSGPYDAVTVAHSETSTGALAPLPELAEVVGARDDVMLLVDSVTGAGGARLATDDWGLDFVLTGSQKALALPPGLAFAVASEALMDRAATLPRRGYYFDLVRYDDNLASSQTPTTPALTLLYALRAQLSRIQAETIEARWARHQEMAERCWSWAEEWSGADGQRLEVLAPPGARSPTVTCLSLPEGVMGTTVVGRVRASGWVIGGGYGRLKDTTIRIGHMGDHTTEALDGLLTVVGEAVRL